MVVPGDAGGWNKEKIRKAISGDAVTVVGTFPDLDSAERGRAALQGAGFSRELTSVVQSGTDAAQEIPSQAASKESHHAGNIGALILAVVGGIIAGLVGSGAIPTGLGSWWLGAGWIPWAVGGILVGAACGYWIGNFFKLSAPAETAARYDQQQAEGTYLVTVLAEPDETEQRAKETLTTAGSGHVASYPYQARPEEFPGAHHPGEVNLGRGRRERT